MQHHEKVYYKLLKRDNIMRKYIISYLKEINDECVDLEEVIEANDIFFALGSFCSKHSVYKRITSIVEI